MTLVVYIMKMICIQDFLTDNMKTWAKQKMCVVSSEVVYTSTTRGAANRMAYYTGGIGSTPVSSRVDNCIVLPPDYFD